MEPQLLLKAVLVGLAGWRIANLLVNEDGPGLVFERLRVWAGVKPGQVSGFIPTLLTCMYCTSVWTTALMWLVWYLSPEAVSLVAASTIALIVERVGGKE